MEELIHIHTRQITLTDAIKAYIFKKLQFLEKFAKHIVHIDVEITENKTETNKLHYEITLHLHKELIRVEEKGNDLYGLIDLAHDILQKKIEQYKDKLTDYAGQKPTILEDMIPHEDEDAYESDPLFYKPRITKHITYSDNRPLHPEEAIEQMEILGRTAFLFKNIESNTYAMVFKQENGDYGIIEPENP